MARELKRINMNMPVEILNRVDEYAESMGINRSSAINVLICQSLDQQKALNGINDAVRILQGNDVKPRQDAC